MTDQIEKYNQKLYHLDELILDIYNAVYAKSDKYKTKFIDVADLKPERFKLSDYDLDSIFTKTKIKYSGSFPTGLENHEQIHFKRQGETYMSTIRVIPYQDKEAINNMSSPVNVNQIIKTLLSELVVNDRSNNLILPIINVDVRGSDLVRFDKVKPYIDAQKYYSVQITEKYYSLTTLDKFLRDYPLDIRVIKTIIYQAVDVLFQISLSYSKFRYNQLFPEMIDCYLKKNDNLTYPELKLSNYFLSEIDEVITNDYLSKTPQESKSSRGIFIPDVGTPYGDLYQLLNYLWNHVKPDIKKYAEIVTLFDTILPKKIRSSEKYLTQKLWDQLTDAEKSGLAIKNIRYNTFFTSKDALLHTTFVESVDNQDFSSRIIQHPPSSELALTEDSPLPQFDMIITESENIELKPDEYSEEIISEKEDTESQTNKKSYNDIDNMSNKNKKTARLSEDTERTEEPEKRTRQSRIVNISESEIGSSRRPSSRKTKTYHGRRQIGLYDANQGKNSNIDYAAFANNSGAPSRINTIGALLGANPTDYQTQKGVNYAQLAQQLTQQYSPEMNQMPQQQYPQPQYPQQQLPGQIPPNQTSQIPMPIQNPFPQQSVQSPDQEALMRYLAASGQLQPQSPYNPVPAASFNPNNVDQNMLTALMQNQQNPQNYSQTGGTKSNHFFFR